MSQTLHNKPATPNVTVLMAVYNGERFLAEAVTSVLSQTFEDFEYLIINDGSTDGTKDLIQSFKDSRIRLVDNDRNIGQTKSLNRGLKMSKGEFLARQDADDISEPDRLQKQVAFMASHRDVALLGTWYTKIDALGNRLGERRLPCDRTDIRWRLLFSSPFVHSSVMLRKSVVLEQVGLYDETFSCAQDFDLWRRIARSLPVANLAEHLVRIRSSPWSMTSTVGDHEGHSIRMRNMADLLGWRNDAMDEVEHERRFRVMKEVLFGLTNVVSGQDVKSAVKDLLQLQTAFAADYKLGSADSMNHRRRIRAALVQRLKEIGYELYSRGAYVDAAQIVAQTIPIGIRHAIDPEK